jgi:hypothetical protein
VSFRGRSWRRQSLLWSRRAGGQLCHHSKRSQRIWEASALIEWETASSARDSEESLESLAMNIIRVWN